ncbi:uncharacterized protein LOC134252427 isoform X2 [Saccostrea cucullata]|uniref:uncharacterized protein LOC134252427 isoform X2 n=1 Tax=Saccostrea cuccullata TaxID=36930 RepID=UPI002ED58F3F
MKRSFNRSKSYTEQGYVPVATEESEAEDVFTSDSPVLKKSSPRRSLSDSGADKVKRSIDVASNTSNTESNMSNAQQNPEEENTVENNIQWPTGNKKIILAIGLFTVSLVLHLYSLVNFLQENKSEENFNLPSQMYRLNGSKINRSETTNSCLLTIDYTDQIKEYVDINQDCTPIENLTGKDIKYEFCNPSHYTYRPTKCVCAKIPSNCTKTDTNINCSDCTGFFPKCRHNTSRVICGEIRRCLLSDEDCGKCNCKGTDFTGKYCHLPKKLECRRCLPKDCTSLPPCNNSTKNPCQDTFNSTVMNCTEKENEKAKDCSLEQDNTEKTPNDYKRIEKTENGSATSQKNTFSNATQSDRKTCSRTSKIGFFVLDWVVFVAVIFHIMYAICQNKCTTRDCIPDFLKGRGTTFYYVAVFLLVVIPPIVNCVTCCSTACDVIGKTIPFVKAGFLVVVLFLLRYDDKDRRRNVETMRLRRMETTNNS